MAARGSYDAIRVYLWLGMLSTDDPVKQQLVTHFAPIQAYVNRTGLVPEQIDTATGKVEGQDAGRFCRCLAPTDARRAGTGCTACAS